MTPEEERDKIAREAAEKATKEANWENRMAQLERQVALFGKAVVAAAIYLAAQVWSFISGGGAFK